MFATVTCPACGFKQRVPEHAMGRKIQCPQCQSFYLGGASTPLETRDRPEHAAGASAPGSAPVPLAPAPGEGPIRYNCPRCARSLESPRAAAGQKLNCPGCGQRLQVPAPSPPMVLPAVLPVPVAPAPAPAPGSGRPRQGRRTPVRHQRCLECGRNVTAEDRLLTCPKCGALFCSSACFRNHDAFSHGG